jgi:CheY-like chemotaxis protein
MKILVVEDNPVNAAMLRATLEKERYEVVYAGDGEMALIALEEHPDVDLVITDVMMPTLTGLEMLDRIRQRPEWKTLPVVVATSLANQATVRQAVSLHCKHFIVKPFTVQLLLQTVRDAIGARGVVLQDKGLAVGRIGLDGAGYDQLAVAFSGLVHERVTALQALAEREQQDAIDVTIRRDLYALDESAALLGAERLGNVLAAFGLPSGEIAVAALGGVYKALVTELKLLQGSLPPPPKKPLRIETSESAATTPASSAAAK